jgi:hypothetical protein
LYENKLILQWQPARCDRGPFVVRGYALLATGEAARFLLIMVYAELRWPTIPLDADAADGAGLSIAS